LNGKGKRRKAKGKRPTDRENGKGSRERDKTVSARERRKTQARRERKEKRSRGGERVGEQREREVGASGKGLEEESAPNAESSEQHAVSLFLGLA
jgi:hypothetical protein